jgi:signal transduction histidine kinase
MSEKDTRILIAEDDYLVGEMIKGLAESIGYTIAGEATNGVEAFEMTLELRPDVVLMDFQMPEMDGITATQQICARCPTPVVLLTAYETPELVQRASVAGAAAYLIKPPQAREMERAITVARARFNDLMTMRYLKQEAEDAVRVRDALFALISHDLRSPLTAITAYVHLLKVAGQSVPDPAIAEQVYVMLNSIDGAVARMNGQIDEFLDIARLRAGEKLDILRKPIDIIALARQIVWDYQQTTSLHDLRIDTNVDTLIGCFDVLRMGRVISNLVSNAVKYSPDGGTVTVSIAYESEGTDHWVVLCVEDQGLGIPDADLPQIFDLFHRARNVEGHFRGVGIGLASVQQIVQQHGGAITVHSQIGVGTTFTVRLPLQDAADLSEDSDIPVFL